MTLEEKLALAESRPGSSLRLLDPHGRVLLDVPLETLRGLLDVNTAAKSVALDHMERAHKIRDSLDALVRVYRRRGVM